MKIEKTTSEELLKLTVKAMALAQLVYTKTDYCVFINMSGHVGQLEISIRKNCEEYSKVVAEDEAYIDKTGESKFGLVKLKTIISTLEQILTDGEIDFSGLDYEKEIVKHYKLA